MDYIDQIVSAQISARREAMAVSRQELSDRSGITIQQIQDYETGTCRVPANQLAAIADALGVEAAFFFFLSEETLVENATGCDDTAWRRDADRLDRAMTMLRTIRSESLRRSLMTIIEEAARIDADDASSGSR